MTVRSPRWGTLANQHKQWCRHFTGIQNEICKLGIRYADVKLVLPDGETTPDGLRVAYPCLAGSGHPELCDKLSFPTQEEADEHEREVSAHLAEYLQDLAEDRCPVCYQQITKQQVGRCVYGSCGHRLYQGTLPKGKDVSRAVGHQSKTKAIYSFEWQRARATGQDRTHWIKPDQTKAVFRDKNGERRVVVWNKGKSWRTTDLLQFKEQAQVPDGAHEEEHVRDGWYGRDFRWIV